MRVKAHWRESAMSFRFRQRVLPDRQKEDIDLCDMLMV
jgi:hypothetical protein